jgi:hypothetical protein
MEFANSTLNMVTATDNAVPETSRRRLSIKRAALLVLAFILLALLIHGVHLVRVQAIETAIVQELSPESDVTSVRQFMDAHHILYTGYSPQFRRLYGKIYRSTIGVMKGNIIVQFDFDEHGKLVSHKVVELFDFAWVG